MEQLDHACSEGGLDGIGGGTMRRRLGKRLQTIRLQSREIAHDTDGDTARWWWTRQKGVDHVLLDFGEL